MANDPGLPPKSCISELSSLCICPRPSLPVAVCWVAWWSQGQSEIPAIRLILSELNTWAQASVTRKPSGEAVEQESARTHYFYGSRAIPTCCEGSLPGSSCLDDTQGMLSPLPHLDSDSSTYLGISRSLVNDLEVKLEQAVLLLKGACWRAVQSLFVQVLFFMAVWQMNCADLLLQGLSVFLPIFISELIFCSWLAVV